jgi:xylan 1,4-beta-xylosidase
VNQQEAVLKHYRIDDEHSNAFMVWKAMGSPQQLGPSQYAQLEEAGRLMELGQPGKLKIDSGKASVRFKLPRQAVSLINLTW